MAPEIIQNKKYDGLKIDIFSTGIVLFCLVMGHFPWNEALFTDPLYKYIVNDKISDYWSKFDK